MASYGGSVEVVRMLLKQFNSSVNNEVNNVSVYFIARKNKKKSTKTTKDVVLA